MKATSLEEVIDKGADICGGQNALARQLGMPPGNLSAAKHGKKALPAQKIRELAALVGMDPGEIWKLADERRNPFRQSAAGALASWFLMVLAVILSGAPEPAKASIGAASQPIHNATGIYIVALRDHAALIVRAFTLTVRSLARHVGLGLQRPYPWAC